MTRAISIALLAGGMLLLFFGIDAYNSTSSDVSRLFTGSATDKAIWMIVGGVAATALGLVGAWRGTRTV